MFFIQLVVVLLFIFLGARKGGLGIAYAGAAGVIVLGVLGCKVDPTLAFRGMSSGSSSR